jgi:hypothetical protein
MNPWLSESAENKILRPGSVCCRMLSKLEIPGFPRLGGTGGLAAGFSDIKEALVVNTWS